MNPYRKMVTDLFGDNKKVYVVEGAPGSGKTTWVKKHKGENDLVVDLDAICSAIQLSDSSHPNYGAVMDEVMMIRDSLVDSIANRSGKWSSAYVITAKSDTQYVDDLVKKLGAEKITMYTKIDDINKYIDADATRKDKEWSKELALRWFKDREGQDG